MSQASAKWNTTHRKECALATARWRAKNPEKVREQNRRRHELNPEYSKLWARKNRVKRRVVEEKWRAANPERYQIITARARAKYLASHPERAKLNARFGQQRRRTRVKNAPQCDKASVNLLCQLISSASRLKCGICGKNMPKNDRTIDHVIPLSKGGSGEVWNLRIVHMVCNAKKNATMPEELKL